MAQEQFDLAIRSRAAGLEASDLKNAANERDKAADVLLEAACAMVTAERKRATTVDELGDATAIAKSSAADRLRRCARAFVQSETELHLALGAEVDDIKPVETQLAVMDAALLTAARGLAEEEKLLALAKLERERQHRSDDTKKKPS